MISNRNSTITHDVESLAETDSQNDMKPFYKTTAGIVILCVLGAGVLATCIAVPICLTSGNNQQAPIPPAPKSLDFHATKIQNAWRHRSAKSVSSGNAPQFPAGNFNEGIVAEWHDFNEWQAPPPI